MGTWSGGDVQTIYAHGGTNSYGVLSSATPDITYTWDPEQIFLAGVRYVVDVWARQDGANVSKLISFGKAGADESTDAHNVASSGGWNKWRVCWTPTADRTGVRFRWQETQTPADLFLIDDLALYTTANDPLAGTSPRAARCDHNHLHGLLAGLANDDHTQYVETANGGDEDANVVAATGSAETIDLSTGNHQDFTLDADCTFTMPAAGRGKSFTAFVREDGTGGWIPTFTGVVWPGGATPTWDTDPGALNIVAFVSDGTSWYGFPAGGDAAAAALIVREVGGSDIDPVSTLEFDTDDFEVSDQTAGVARVALVAGIGAPTTRWEPVIFEGAIVLFNGDIVMHEVPL